MDLKSLEYFLACVKRGSLTGAAEELYTTQPHVSQVIKNLEWELGVKLFKRTGTGIELTGDGEKIRFYAENTLKNAELIKETCSLNNNETLRIAVNSSSRLAYSMEEFLSREENADISLNYMECSIEEMMNYITMRHFDLGLLFVPANRLSAFSYMAEHRHLKFTTLLESDLLVSCGKKSPFWGREIIEPEELDGCTCVRQEDDYFSIDELLLENEGFRTGKWTINRRVSTNSNHLILRILRNTDMCYIGSYWTKNSDGAEDYFGPTINGFQKQVYFGYMQADNRELSDKAKEFLDRIHL
ncbi:MAG: LysR family transcriptional regulator [Lachnospiraceae bacterium]|nr:LysR family transcriptional regulator [Lachnospiraceae bacterium]